MDNMIVILGPTASGKTALAVTLSSKFNGEIISADSRQIYKGMDIGTGKDLDEYTIDNNTINYHLIDILDPKEDYSVFQFKKDYKNAVNNIISKNKLPILCGGTGFYIESVLLDYQIPSTKPNNQLREKLEQHSIKKLTNQLIAMNKKAFDKRYHLSKRRLIRSIEILENQKNINMQELGSHILDNTLVIGVDVQRAVILESIKNRLHSRLNEGMIAEVEGLLKTGISYERLNYFGLEYKFIGEYLAKKIHYNKMVEKLTIGINKFSKRQMTFFRRMEKRGIKIHWFKNHEIKKIELLVKSFLNHS